MNTIYIFVGLVIAFAATSTIKRDELKFEPEQNFLNASKTGFTTIVYHNVKIVSRFEWITELPVNATLKEQQQILDEFIHKFEDHIDNLRAKKRMEQENDTRSHNTETQEDKITEDSISLADFLDIFPLGGITVGPDNTIRHEVLMSDKIYDELDKKHVRETSWFKKVLKQMKSDSKIETGEYVDLVGDMVKEMQNVYINPLNTPLG